MKIWSVGLLAAAFIGGCTNQVSSSDQNLSLDDSEMLSQSVAQSNCTYTQGFWKTHPEAWPVSSVVLGNVNYSKSQLLAIFGNPVRGNGLVALAHQLIAAKLNVAAGANSSVLGSAFSVADALIGSRVVPPVGNGTLSTNSTATLVGQLDAFNSGKIGPGHCGDAPPPPPPPPPPVCGNGVLESGEQCDDGNHNEEDGCNSACEICSLPPPPPPPPVCGNGVLESGEQCDDGNHNEDDGCTSACEICPVQ